MCHLVNAHYQLVLPVLYTGRLFLVFAGPVTPTGKAIVSVSTQLSLYAITNKVQPHNLNILNSPMGDNRKLYSP